MNKRYLLPGIFLSSTALAQSPPPVDALPEGGRVIAGEAAIDQTDATLSIHQTSDRAAIDWRSFDVGSRATVEFLQPSNSSVTLNRVTGANASQIFGRITANGQVFLSNPNGVYFAPGASVNVGGLVATTHGISVDDFMAGRVKFERNGATGGVINEGELTAALGGYIALLAPEVRNQGLILANLGTVALAAGETFELQFGSNNTLANLRVTPSTIHALVENRSAVLAPGGLILLSAQAVDRIQGGVIRHSGALEATSVARRGGRIVLEGDAITLASGSRIDASGHTGGGEVLIGGGWQGTGDIHQAHRVSMDPGASIDVSAIDSGDGGTAVLWSDVHAAGGVTNVHGEIFARGGASGGNGGRIETSGHSVVTDGIRVNAAAQFGSGGTWLIDPFSYNIGAPAAATISSALSTGTSVTVTTTADNAGFGSSGNVNDTGGIAVNSAITKSGGSDATLTLQAHRNVGINAPVSSSVGRLNLVLWSDYANDNIAGVAVSGALSTNGGHVWIGGSSSNGGSSIWNGLTVGNGPSVGSVSANYNSMDLSADITTGGGDVLIWTGAGVLDTNSGPGIGLNGARSINAGSGNVTLLSNKVFNWQNSGALDITSTGLLTLAPSLNNAYDAAFDWTGTNTAGNLRLNNTLSANTLTINGVASLGGLAIGQFTGMSGVTIANTSNVTIPGPLSIAGPVAIHGGAVNVQQSLSAAGNITLRAVTSDVLLDGAITNTAASATGLTIEAARHIRLGSNASIASSIAAMNSQLWADTNADADGIVYLTSSGITTQGGSLTFGRDGQTANIGGSSVRVGGDVFFQRGSAQTLSTGGGALNVYGETIVANTAGLAIDTGNGAANFYGLLNSGNAYNFVNKTGSAGSETWDAARIEARNGTAGASAVGDSYLATVTSRLENAIAGLTANYSGSWIGAYRPDTTSYSWAWSDGPEAGQIFFTQGAGGGGTTGAGFYANFASGEPNGALNASRLSTESVGQFFGSAGLWNDLTHNTAYAASQTNQYAVLGFVRETNLAASPVTINAGTGTVTVHGGVGLSKALASFNVTSSATTVNGSGLLTTGAQTYSGSLAANAGSNNLLLQGTSITAGGALMATGADITLNANLFSTSAGAPIELRASGNINTSASRTLQTNNGNLTLWSDGDGTGAGHIALGNNNSLNSADGATAQVSGGGRITLAGGSAVDGAGLPAGFAASATVHGVSLGSTSANTTTIYSGGGDVLINGTTTSTSSTGDATFHGLAGWGTLTLNAGQGAISLAGTSTDAYGLVLSRGGIGTSTLSSARATGTAISLAGTTTAANTHGVVLDNNATEAILATGGGAIAINGTGTGTGYGVWLQGSRVLASSGVIAVNGGAGGINSAGSANVLGKYTSDITTSSSDITLTGNRFALAGLTTIDTTGALTVQPFDASFSSALTWPLVNLSLPSTLSGLTLGKPGNLATITVSSAQSISGPISIYAGDITINAGLQAGGDTITLQGSGNVTDGTNGFVSALNLRLLGGNVTLDNANNGVGYLAASGVGDLTYIDSNTLVLNTIGGISGISATGIVNIGTLVGDLSLLDNVSTTNTSTTALTLNAGINANAGTATGGSLFVFNNAAVSVGAGGRGRLFTGSVADTGLGVLVGSGSNRFRYNSDELATNYTLALGTGLYAIHREQPTVSLRVENQSMVYGDTVPAWTFSLDNARNGDTYAQSFTGTPGVSVGGATSTSAQYIAGGHALTGATGSAASQLGYALSPTVAAGILTVTPRTLSVTYAGVVKIYDGNTIATVNDSDNRVATDAFAIAETASFADANAGAGKTVNVTGIGLSGTDAANYTVVTTSSTTAAITARQVTLSGNRAYDGTTAFGAGTVTLGNLVGTETLGFSGATANDAHVATGGKYLVSIALLDGANGGLASNYLLPTLNLANAPVTITARAIGGSAAIGGTPGKTYDGTTAAGGANVSGSVTGAVSGDSILLDLNAISLAYNSAHVANATSIGASGVAGFSIDSSTSGSLASDYSFTSPVIAAVAAGIAPATLTTTLSNSAVTRAYDGTTSAPAGFTPAWNFTGLIAGDTAASLISTGAAFDSKDVLTASTITVSGLGIDGITGSNGSMSTDYVLDATSKFVAASITSRAVTITGLVANDKVYDGNNAVTLNDAGSVVAGVSNETLNLSNAGATFSDANAGTGKLVSATGYAIFDGTNGGLASNYALTSTTATTTADITPRLVTLSGDRVYDGTTAFGAGTVTLGNLVGTESLGFSGATASDAHVATSGKYLASIALLDGTNGGLAGNYLLPTLNVANAPVTITARAIGGSATIGGTLVKTYDGTTAASGASISGSVTGAVSGDVILLDSSAIALAYNSAHVANGTSIGASGVAGFSINSSTHGSLATDYSFTSPVVSAVAASITPRFLQVIGLAASDKTYDGTNTVGITDWGGVSTGVGSETLSVAATGATFSDPNAATGKTVTASGYALSNGTNGGLASNYSLTSTTAATTANIDRAVLTVIANDHAKFVTRPDDAGYGSLSYDGFVYGETAGVLTGNATIFRTNPGTNAAGIYSDVLTPDVSGLASTNYSFVLQNGDYTIVPSNRLLVQVANSTTSYGTELGYTIGSAEYLDANTNSVISLSNITDDGNGRFTVSDGAGGAASFTVSLVNAPLSGAGFARAGAHQLDATGVTALNAQNFNDQLTLIGSRDITQRGISAVAEAGVSKEYDGTTAMVGVQIGLIDAESADALSVFGTGEFSSRNAGTDLRYAVGGVSLGGADASNYFLTGGTSFTGDNGSITPRTLVVNYGGVDKVYDGNTNAMVTMTDNRIAGDALAFDLLAAFADKNAGTAKAITIGGVTLSGADAGNYLVSSGGSSSANITRLDSVTWTGGTNGNWFDPANWAGGAVPDLANVANVILPAGVNVSFDVTGVLAPVQIGPVNLDSLGTAGHVTQNNGALAIGAGGVQLDGYTQNGGLLSGDGDIVFGTFTQTGGSTTTGGNFTVAGNFSQGTSGSMSVGGDMNITDIAGGTTVGNLTTGGDLNVTSTGGDITQATGTAIAVDGDANLQAPGNHVTLNPSGNTFEGVVTVVDASPTVVMPPALPPAEPALMLPTPRTSPSVADSGSMDVSVALITAPSNQTPGLVSVTVPSGMTSTGYSFALPEEVMTELSADTYITATHENGGRLPAWLSYDAKSQRFVATQSPANVLPIRVVATDGARRVTVEITTAP